MRKQRGLAGAVGTDEAEQLAGPHGERDAAERRGLTEALHDGVDRTRVAGSAALAHRDAASWRSARRDEAHVGRHADLQEAALVGHANLDRVDEVGALVARLDGRRRELGLRGHPRHGAGEHMSRFRRRRRRRRAPPGPRGRTSAGLRRRRRALPSGRDWRSCTAAGPACTISPALAYVTSTVPAIGFLIWLFRIRSPTCATCASADATCWVAV